jgi:putative glutathione S-transferase
MNKKRLVNGTWTSDTPTEVGARFTERIGEGAHPAVAGRYHLYASLGCPYSHRALLGRALRGLEDAVAVTILDPVVGDDGWAFEAPDPRTGARLLREIYLAASPRFTGAASLPVLWDAEARTIVNNQSRDILRMLDVGMSALAKRPTLYPDALAARVDALLDAMAPFNAAPARAGQARSQEDYEKAVVLIFDALDGYERVLGQQRWLCGDAPTEADVCLFTTLFRFDAVYYPLYWCNRRSVRSYKALTRFLHELEALPGAKDTCDMAHVKRHYFLSDRELNPRGILPVGPVE